MILIDAVYINKSGGKVLLEYLIDYIIKNNKQKRYFFLLDERIQIDFMFIPSTIEFSFIKAGESNRKVFYKEKLFLFHSVFCFANVPPPIKIKNKKVTIYFHNILLANFLQANLSIFEMLYYSFKKLYIKFQNHSNYSWLVQSSIIGDLIKKEFGIGKTKIFEVPFFNLNLFNNCNKSSLLCSSKV